MYVVMEEEHKKSKLLSHVPEFKREVVWCAEEKGNCKAAAVFVLDENSVLLWWKYNAAMNKCEAHERDSLNTRKDDFVQFIMRFLCFFKRHKTGIIILYFSYSMYSSSVIFPKTNSWL
jgi:hypothetical protein